MHVAPAGGHRVADPALVVAEDRPVAVVELLDDLERPATLEDIAADELALELGRELLCAGGAQLGQDVVEREVGLADELVERIQVAASALERLQRLGHVPGGGDGIVTRARRTIVRIHPADLPTRSTSSCLRSEQPERHAHREDGDAGDQQRPARPRRFLADAPAVDRAPQGDERDEQPERHEDPAVAHLAAAQRLLAADEATLGGRDGHEVFIVAASRELERSSHAADDNRNGCPEDRKNEARAARGRRRAGAVRARHRGRVRRRGRDRDLRAGRRHLRLRAAGILLASTWQLVGGRSARRLPPAGAPAPGGPLRELAADECRAVGVPQPDELRLTPGRELEVHREGSARVLVVGLAALAEHGPEALRLGVADAVAIDADDEHRRLSRMREGLIARALAIGETHPVSSAPWRWLAGVAARRLDAAIAERVRAAGGRLDPDAGADVAAERRERFETYWATAVLLGLRAGFRPPIAEGWRRTLETEEPASLGLLDEPLDALEARVLGAADRDRARELVPVSWERFGEAVLLPWARERVAGAAWLAEWELADAADLAAMAGDNEQVEVLGFAVLVALADEGWSVEFEPPLGVSATGEDVSVDPLALVYGVAEGAFEPDEWREFTTTTEIAHAPLAPRVDAAAAGHELDRLPVAPPGPRSS